MWNAIYYYQMCSMRMRPPIFLAFAFFAHYTSLVLSGPVIYPSHCPNPRTIPNELGSIGCQLECTNDADCISSLRNDFQVVLRRSQQARERKCCLSACGGRRCVQGVELPWVEHPNNENYPFSNQHSQKFPQSSGFRPLVTAYSSSWAIPGSATINGPASNKQPEICGHFVCGWREVCIDIIIGECSVTMNTWMLCPQEKQCFNPALPSCNDFPCSPGHRCVMKGCHKLDCNPHPTCIPVTAGDKPLVLNQSSCGDKQCSEHEKCVTVSTSPECKFKDHDSLDCGFQEQCLPKDILTCSEVGCAPAYLTCVMKQESCGDLHCVPIAQCIDLRDPTKTTVPVVPVTWTFIPLVSTTPVPNRNTASDIIGSVSMDPDVPTHDTTKVLFQMDKNTSSTPSFTDESIVSTGVNTTTKSPLPTSEENVNQMPNLTSTTKGSAQSTMLTEVNATTSFNEQGIWSSPTPGMPDYMATPVVDPPYMGPPPPEMNEVDSQDPTTLDSPLFPIGPGFLPSPETPIPSSEGPIEDGIPSASTTILALLELNVSSSSHVFSRPPSTDGILVDSSSPMTISSLSPSSGESSSQAFSQVGTWTEASISLVPSEITFTQIAWNRTSPPSDTSIAASQTTPLPSESSTNNPNVRDPLPSTTKQLADGNQQDATTPTMPNSSLDSSLSRPTTLGVEENGSSSENANTVFSEMASSSQAITSGSSQMTSTSSPSDTNTMGSSSMPHTSFPNGGSSPIILNITMSDKPMALPSSATTPSTSPSLSSQTTTLGMQAITNSVEQEGTINLAILDTSTVSGKPTTPQDPPIMTITETPKGSTLTMAMTTAAPPSSTTIRVTYGDSDLLGTEKPAVTAASSSTSVSTAEATGSSPPESTAISKLTSTAKSTPVKEEDTLTNATMEVPLNNVSTLSSFLAPTDATTTLSASGQVTGMTGSVTSASPTSKTTTGLSTVTDVQHANTSAMHDTIPADKPSSLTTTLAFENPTTLGTKSPNISLPSSIVSKPQSKPPGQGGAILCGHYVCAKGERCIDVAVNCSSCKYSATTGVSCGELDKRCLAPGDASCDDDRVCSDSGSEKEICVMCSGGGKTDLLRKPRPQCFKKEPEICGHEVCSFTESCLETFGPSCEVPMISSSSIGNASGTPNKQCISKRQCIPRAFNRRSTCDDDPCYPDSICVMVKPVCNKGPDCPPPRPRCVSMHPPSGVLCGGGACGEGEECREIATCRERSASASDVGSWVSWQLGDQATDKSVAPDANRSKKKLTYNCYFRLECFPAGAPTCALSSCKGSCVLLVDENCRDRDAKCGAPTPTCLTLSERSPRPTIQNFSAENRIRPLNS